MSEKRTTTKTKYGKAWNDDYIYIINNKKATKLTERYNKPSYIKVRTYYNQKCAIIDNPLYIDNSLTLMRCNSNYYTIGWQEYRDESKNPLAIDTHILTVHNHYIIEIR